MSTASSRQRQLDYRLATTFQPHCGTGKITSDVGLELSFNIHVLLSHDMKERITYIHRADDPFEPSQLSVGEGSLDISNLRAARDHQLTFDLEELPKEV